MDMNTIVSGVLIVALIVGGVYLYRWYFKGAKVPKE